MVLYVCVLGGGGGGGMGVRVVCVSVWRMEEGLPSTHMQGPMESSRVECGAPESGILQPSMATTSSAHNVRRTNCLSPISL